jgi:membrane-associated phospholipid phosphatase
MALAAGVVLEAAPARAADQDPTPIDAFGDDLVEAFTGARLIFYGAAVAETGVMAFGGGDHAVRVFFRRNLAVQAWGDSANVAGYVVPALVAPSVWIVGLVTHDRYGLGAGSAAVQALGTTLAVTALLKWSVGRSYPLNGGDPNAPDVLDHPEYARSFRPFRLDGGWAWPSGHTSASFSVVAALSAWDPDSLAIPLIGYPLAAAIGVGMVDGDHHWTSDVIAGGLFGYAIGHSIGDSFHSRRAQPNGDKSPDSARGLLGTLRSVHFVPMTGGTVGGMLVGVW